MKIAYSNEKLEKIFADYVKMQKKIPFEWVRAIKKHIGNLIASENWGIFLDLKVGKPEQLKGFESIRYSLHISQNVRLILELDKTTDIRQSKEITIIGVCDYHGDKENWYIK